MAMNKWVGIGRLGRDPELRVTNSNNKRVCSVALCVERDQSQHSEENTVDWINLVLWEKNAEIFCKYCKKGMLLAVTGRIQSRTYEDIKGNDRITYEIVVDKFWFLLPPESAKPAENQGPGGETRPARRRMKNGRPVKPVDIQFTEDDSEDELPF